MGPLTFDRQRFALRFDLGEDVANAVQVAVGLF
jgi:hypothetical protein